MRQKKSTGFLEIIKQSMVFFMLLCFSIALHAQDISISGTVTDGAGVPMPGVNIIVKGKNAATVSDLNGKFSIKCNAGDILTASFVGYQSYEITVGAETNIAIVLNEDVKQLNEVVVIGYGVQKRSDLTGAVASVSAQDMAKSGNGNVVQAMQGRAAGVQVTPSTGLPGSETQIRIRGISSLNGQEVKWIVDGVATGPNSVNPADIESMEILKDASSAAIYGATGANGVVLVTTKKGSNKKEVTASVNYYKGWDELPNTIDVLNGNQFADMVNQMRWIQNSKNGVVDITLNPAAYNPDTMKTYNYQKLMFRNAPIENIDISVSGGGEKLTSYFSLGYNSTDGIIKNMNYSRINMMLKNDYAFNKYLKVGSKIVYNTNERKGVQEWRFFDEYNSPLSAAISFSPFIAPYKTGAHPDSIWNTNPISNITNPLLTVDLTDIKSKGHSGDAIFFTEITPFKGLKLESRYSASVYFNYSREVNRKYYYNASNKSDQNKMRKDLGRGYGWNWQNILEYNTTLLDNYNITAMVGTEAGLGYNTSMYFTQTGLLSINEDMLYFGAPVDTAHSETYGEGAAEVRGFSYFGRLSADYKSMILLQGNIRQDANSKFGPKNRIGVFPGMSVGFKFSELEFFKDIPWFSFGKIRYGWGQSGNSALQDYSYYSQIGSGISYANAQYSFDDISYQNGAVPINLANTAIKWETVETTNLGLDLNFFKNKLSLSIDRFTRSNIDMLYLPNIPGIAGWNLESGKLYFENNNVNPTPYANIGKITSKGWEVVLGYKDNLGKLKYEVSANVTYVNTKAVNIKGDTIYKGAASRPNGTFTRTFEGGNIGEFYGYKINKIFKPSDCDTFQVNISTNINKPRWGTVVKATNQPIKEIVSSFMGLNTKTGDSVFRTKSKIDTIFVQNNATAGDFQFEDTNGDGVLNDKDYQSLGNPFAPFLYGLNINLEYGWFDLNMMWQGTYGNKIFNTRRGQLFNADGQSNWSTDYYNNYYRDALYDTDGNLLLAVRDGKYPRLDPSNRNQNLSSPSEFYIEDGSYLRLKNIQLGITLPDKYTRYIGVTNLRVYVGAKNVLTFTKYSGLDPEVDLRYVTEAGIDRGAYPIPRSYIFGASLNF